MSNEGVGGMGLLIRYAGKEDIDVLASVHSQSLRAAYKDIIPDDILNNDFSIERRKLGFIRELEVKKPFNAVAFDSGNPVGLLSFGDSRHIEISEDSIELWRIYLLPKYWGIGFGEELFNWGMSEIKARGYMKVILWVLEENNRARRFYEKNGFTHNGQKIEESQGKKLTELLYIRSL